MNKVTKLLAGLTLTLIATGIFALPALAQTVIESQPYQPLTTIPGLTQKGTPTNPVEIIKGIYGLAIGVGAVIATVMIIWAGFEYMYQESITGKSNAKQRIYNAFIGLFVILGSYILLRTINPDLVDFNITLEGGTGRVKTLIAVQEEFDNATKRIREAQTNANKIRDNIKANTDKIDKIGREIDQLNSELDTADTPEEQEAILEKTRELEIQRTAAVNQNKILVVEEKYIRATGGLDLNVSSMEESLLTDGNNNISGNIKRALDDIQEAREALKKEAGATASPVIAARLAELDMNETLFRARASQLNVINRFNNNLIDEEEDAAAEIRNIGNRNIEAFTKAGRPDLVNLLNEETTRRIKVVCPKCSR